MRETYDHHSLNNYQGSIQCCQYCNTRVQMLLVTENGVKKMTVLISPPHVRVALPPREEVGSEVVRNMVHIRCVPASAAYTSSIIPTSTCKLISYVD